MRSLSKPFVLLLVAARFLLLQGAGFSFFKDICEWVCNCHTDVLDCSRTHNTTGAGHEEEQEEQQHFHDRQGGPSGRS
jgi:hypothetical protein